MDTNRNYSLFIDNIERSVSAFITHEAGLVLQIDKHDADKIVCRITKGKAAGVVTFYIKKNGLVSMNIQGAKSLNSDCERCCEYVIQQTAIPNSLRKSFTVRSCKTENIELFKLELTDSYKYSVCDKGIGNNTTIAERFDIEDNSKTGVTCTLYKNGTYLLQGNVTSLFVGVLTESLRWLVDSTKLDSVSNAIALNNTTHVFSDDIKVLVPNLDKSGDTDGILDRMILTSVALFNSGVLVEDYGSYTFGVLKALEGVLKLRLSEDFGTIDKLGDYYYFDNPSHRHRLNTTMYDGDMDLKRALTNGYNNWVSSRHSSFHADEQISTSTLLSYEQAHEVFVKTMGCINDICNNWH